MSNDQPSDLLPREVFNSARAAVIAASVVGIVIGILLLFFTDASLLVISLLFGISLVVLGLFRLFFAFAVDASLGIRILLVVLGALIVAAGVLSLLNPVDGLWLLSIFIGTGWLLSGFHDLFGAQTGLIPVPRWAMILSGLLSVIAGIAMIVMPYVALGALIWVSGGLLIAISVFTLVTLPRKA